MRRKSTVGWLVLGLVFAIYASSRGLDAGQRKGEAVSIDADDIGGVVTSSKGPEAGVWVIAETKDLSTGFRKIVVTDDQGRYVVPDLPAARYDVWVRGYGLVDSQKIQATPGRELDLKAVIAPTPRDAAQYYPANYWYSLLQPPEKGEFPGTGPNGNGIGQTIMNQQMWMASVKTWTCTSCHQLGSKYTREILPALGTFESHEAAWDRRVQSGQSGSMMDTRFSVLGRKRAMEIFGDWTRRIEKGEVPVAPPRPQGLERNVVITSWDWADSKSYVHDSVATDRRKPTLNGYGPVYGASEISGDWMPIVDPVKNTAERVRVPVKDPKMEYKWPQDVLQPSPYWGKETIWQPQADPHTPAMDGKGRVWIGATDQPVYDPATKSFTLTSCGFGGHHIMFGEDEHDTAWFDIGPSLGFCRSQIWDQTKDAAKASGRIPFILDTNGNGKQDAYVKPNEPIDPTKDKLINRAGYGVTINPVDGSVWLGVNDFPGALIRVVPGANPPATSLAEVYEPPFNNPKAPVEGYNMRGVDVDRNGVVWTALGGSGHVASFDRRKCTGPLNGPTATGQHCPEGWTLTPTPGPHFKGVRDSGSADSHYYIWVDQYDTFGMGTNMPIATGSGSDSLLVFDPKTRKYTVLRVPYPMGFHSRGLDGRIDDPKAGWKGRGLWSTYAQQAVWHIEGGRGQTAKLVHFQLRPNPLAK